MTRKGPKVELVVTGPGARLAQTELTEMGVRARNARPVMQSVMRHLVQVEREQFASEGARGGQRWPRKKQVTLEREERAGHRDERTERFTGALYESLTSERAGGSAIRRTSKQAATFGSRLYYGAFQSTRPLIQVTKQDEDWIAGEISRWLLFGELS